LTVGDGACGQRSPCQAQSSAAAASTQELPGQRRPVVRGPRSPRAGLTTGSTARGLCPGGPTNAAFGRRWTWAPQLSICLDTVPVAGDKTSAVDSVVLGTSRTVPISPRQSKARPCTHLAAQLSPDRRSSRVSAHTRPNTPLCHNRGHELSHIHPECEQNLIWVAKVLPILETGGSSSGSLQ